MKKTKENKNEKISNSDILIIESFQEAKEFKRIATGRKFCKQGERMQDICDEELNKYYLENSDNIFIKILNYLDKKSNKKKLLLENRETSIIRAIAFSAIIDDENTNLEALIKKVRACILEKVEEYEKSKKEA